jgi:hypothetical protein
MSYLPEPTTSQVPARTVRGALTVRRGEVEVFSHEVRVAVTLAKEQIDCLASADATRYCLNEELNLLAYGQARAGSDPMSHALVGRKIAALAERNDRRLTKRFG